MSRSSAGAHEGRERTLYWFKLVSNIELIVLTYSITASGGSLKRVNPTAATGVFGLSMTVAVRQSPKNCRMNGAMPREETRQIACYCYNLSMESTEMRYVLTTVCSV